MVNGRIPSVFSKTYVTPRRPYEKARLDQELRIIGEYGLRNTREVWRVKYTLAKIRKAARELLTLEEKDPKRLFEGWIYAIYIYLLIYTFNRYFNQEVVCILIHEIKMTKVSKFINMFASIFFIILSILNSKSVLNRLQKIDL